MISEKVYRALLVVYPKEYRREYADLMVQMYRDRMRHEGGGFRMPIIWTQMMLDLAVSAIEEHRRGADMKKRVWIATASLVTLLAVAVGAGVVLSQPSDKFENDEFNMRVFVWNGSETVSFEGKSEVIGVLEREFEESVTIQESELGVTISYNERAGFDKLWFSELPAGFADSSRDGQSDVFIFAWLDSNPLPPTGEKVDEIREATEYYAEDLRQWVKEGEMDHEEAERELARARRWETILLEEWD